MTDQKPIPWVLKRRFLVTLLAGVGAAVMSLVIFLIANDRIILVLAASFSSVVFFAPDPSGP